MTTDCQQEPAWQEDEQRSHERLKVVRDLTPGCPCDRCVSRDTCKVTHHECAGYLRWVATGTTKEEMKMIFSKKTEPEHPDYKDAVERYEQAAGLLFEKPVKNHCKYEKNAWLLFNRDAVLIAIVSDDSVLFGANIAGMMQQVAESWAE